jgi:hypothetical protein
MIDRELGRTPSSPCSVRQRESVEGQDQTSPCGLILAPWRGCTALRGIFFELEAHFWEGSGRGTPMNPHT